MFVNKSATDLSVVAATSAIQSAGLKPDQIDHVIFGNVLTVKKIKIQNILHFINYYRQIF